MQRSRRRWWLNTPWYTDWALQLGTAVTVVVTIEDVAHEGFTAVAALDALVDLLLGSPIYVGGLLVIRGVCRAIFRVPPARLGLPRDFKVTFQGGGVVSYRRDRDGRVVEQVHGVPPAKRAAALRAARPRAAKAGFVVKDQPAPPPR